jgi:hypothetical protein
MANLQTLLGDFTFENLPPAWTAGDRSPSGLVHRGRLRQARQPVEAGEPRVKARGIK